MAKSIKRNPVGRPRINPVLKPDMFGRPLRKGDMVHYSVPGNHKGSGAMVFGEIIGKRHAYIEIICLMDKHYEETHCKHGFQVVRMSGDILKYIKTREEVLEENTQELEEKKEEVS